MGRWQCTWEWMEWLIMSIKTQQTLSVKVWSLELFDKVGSCWKPGYLKSKGQVGAETGKVWDFRKKMKEFMLNDLTFLSDTDHLLAGGRMRAGAWWGAWWWRQDWESPLRGTGEGASLSRIKDLGWNRKLKDRWVHTCVVHLSQWHSTSPGQPREK